MAILEASYTFCRAARCLIGPTREAEVASALLKQAARAIMACLTVRIRTEQWTVRHRM